MEKRWWFAIGLGAILLLAVLLRLKGIHDPILDHPNWRQGDTASIARNFAELNYNILSPQTNYDGPPPNYVELELQIVPFLAATLYKIFGVHEIFGRLITLLFSVATVGILGLFGRWLFSSCSAGIAAALVYAIIPGSVYYGRTFTPDATMVFFLTAALYASARFTFEDARMEPRSLARVTALVILAYLAKPVALVAIVPIITMLWERARRTASTQEGALPPMRATAVAVLLFVPVVILYLYQRTVAQHAEWHWTSGITQLHVLPALSLALTSSSGFLLKLQQFWLVLHLLANTMLGHVVTLVTLIAILMMSISSLRNGGRRKNVGPTNGAMDGGSAEADKQERSPEGGATSASGDDHHFQTRSTSLLWAWLISGLIYTYLVVTVERVDYYMFLLLPLAALFIGGLVAYTVSRLRLLSAAYPRNDNKNTFPTISATAAWACALVALALVVWTLQESRAAVAPYYRYNKQAYKNAGALSHTLAPNALVVMGHYGPDVLYYMHRYGWEEDPYAWTPFDEESAIKKGARYFISIEDNRLRKNLELCAWLQRFPVLNANAQWPVYVTDPTMIRPGTDAFWKQFRLAERSGNGRQFLDSHGVCKIIKRIYD